MADLAHFLAILELDPDDAQAMGGLREAAVGADAALAQERFAAARKGLIDRGRPDAAIALVDAQLDALGADAGAERRAELLLEKGLLLHEELLDPDGAARAFEEVLVVRPDDELAKEALADLSLDRENWQKFADKYVSEAKGSTDRALATSMYVAAAAYHVRFAPTAPEIGTYLDLALEIDPLHRKAVFHRARALARAEQWDALAAFWARRAEQVSNRDAKVTAHVALAELAAAHLADPARAKAELTAAHALDPGDPRVVRLLRARLAAEQDFAGLLEVLQGALKARRGGDEGAAALLAEIGELSWKRLGDENAAEVVFHRLRKVDSANASALDFYRAYYGKRDEPQKLLQILRQAEKAISPKEPGAEARLRVLGLEIAELAEAQGGNPEKAIEAWKQLYRQNPQSHEARAALSRLYRRAERWNALIDLLKEDLERTDSSASTESKLEVYFELVEIYRDRQSDLMVVNTYNNILKLDPENQRAIDELAERYRSMSRWNDLIAVLTRKAELAHLRIEQRVAILQEVAQLWTERFGNFANAIKPLERILELAPEHAATRAQLKDIYTRRRQWRALIELLDREAGGLPPAERRAQHLEMARLATERLGDTRLAIVIANRVLADTSSEDAAEHPELADALGMLAGLYDREKRYLALAEIMHRQRALTSDAKEAVAILERLGAVYSDRLSATAAAAAIWQEILDLDPHHSKALRTLRELYAAAGDYDGLERLYARIGMADDVVEALLGVADRLEGKALRLPIVERAAVLADKRAAESDRPDAADRAARVWERVLAVEPNHVAAAAALAPAYRKAEKWARLLSVLEIQLAAAEEPDDRRRRMEEIRELCKDKLGSKALAFTWAMRELELDPQSAALRAELVRLASEPDQYRELATIFGRYGEDAALPAETRVELIREQARLMSRRLSDVDAARALYRRLWEMVPDDVEAESQLEEFALQLADWADLRKIYVRQLARKEDATDRARLLLELAGIEEEKLVDLDAAAATYERVLELDERSAVALRALSRVHEARGDWESLVENLGRERAREEEPASRIELSLRMGALEAQSLDRHDRALPHYLAALAEAEAHERSPAAAVAALARYLAPAGAAPRESIDAAARLALARRLAPHFAAASDRAQLAAALELIRADDGTSGEEREELDRRLLHLYHGDLADRGAAWDVAKRIVDRAPTDAGTRRVLRGLAGELGRDGELAEILSSALEAARKADAPAAQIRALATENAQLAAQQLGDDAGAERAWLTVLETDETAADAYEALALLYRLQERYSELRELLQRRIEASPRDEERRDALIELGGLEQTQLQDRAAAISTYRRVLELEPAHRGAHRALDELLTAAERWAELDRLLEEQAAQWASPSDADVRRALAFRRAELRATRLERPDEAIDLLEELLEERPDDEGARRLLEELMLRPALAARVARLLEPCYEREGAWRQLVAALRAQRGDLAGLDAAALLARVAVIEEEKLGAPRSAFETWSDVLALDPADERGRRAVLRLALGQQRGAEAAAVLEKAAAQLAADVTGDVAARVALLGELAALYDRELGEPDQAIATYQQQLELDAANASVVRSAGTALSRLLEEGARWAELREVLRRRAEWANSGDERRELLVQVAELEDGKLGEVDQAISTWQDVLAEHPGDGLALDALERLYTGKGAWRELVEVLRRRAETSADVLGARGVGHRIAEIYEQKLDDAEEAIGAYLDILESEAGDERALTELARLYRKTNRSGDLLEVLEKQSELAEPSRRRLLEREIAELLGGALGRPAEAQERWAILLASSDDDRETQEHARRAIEATLEDLDLRARAAEVLRPHYQTRGATEPLAALYQRMAEWGESPSARLHALLEVVALRERTGDSAGAFEAQLAALQHAATEPELAEVVEETQRLAVELGREADLIDPYRAIAPDILDAELQRRLYLDIADLTRAVRKDLALARDYYQKVLDAQPEDRRALGALESIHRDDGDDDRLAEVLLRQAEISGTEVDYRVSMMVEAASILSARGRVAEAIDLWEQVLARAPERRDAVDALEILYRRDSRWYELVELYERRLGFTTTIEEAVALRAQIGQIREHEMMDLIGAVENYGAALSGDPHHAEVLAALERLLRDPDARPMAAEVLEPIYVAEQRWQELATVYEARLEASTEPRERLHMTLVVARLYEEQLEDFDAAARWYARLFREDPTDEGVRDQLQRLASVSDSWEFVADTYRDYLEDEPGDTQSVRDVAIAAAAIYDRRLNQVDRALQAYRRALSIPTEPDHPPTEPEVIRRVEDLLTRTARYADLAMIYDEAIARRSSELFLRVLLAKRGRLLEESLRDAKGAIDTWRELALACEDDASPSGQAAHREANAELERLYRSGGHWRELAELFELAVTRAIDPAERVESMLRLADVLERNLGDADRAVDQYEEILLVPSGKARAVAALERLVVEERLRERISELLEPIYRQSDAWLKLVVILDAKLAYVDDPLRQAEMLHEIARIHEQRGGDLRLALEAAARAWHLDVGDNAAVERLLELARRRGAWDFAAAELARGAEETDDLIVSAGLWARVAEVHDTHRGDLPEAIKAWQRVLSILPEDQDALVALDRLLTGEGRVEELVDVLERRAELANDGDERSQLLHRAAALYEEVLNRPQLAVTAYRNALVLDDADGKALDGLDRLYAQIGDWRELVGIISRKIELAAEVGARLALRRGLAQVYERDLQDDFGAIGQLHEILEEDADNLAALSELDRLYDKARLWPELLEIIDRRMALALHSAERADLGTRAARLVEVELVDPLAAIGRYQDVLEAAPAHAGARAALEALLSSDDYARAAAAVLEPVYRSAQDAGALVRLYERRLVLEELDEEAQLATFAALAEVHETMAGQPGAALEVWSRALSSQPDEIALLEPLRRVAGQTNRWADLASLLEQHLGRALDPDVHHVVAMTLGEIYEERLSELTGAASAFERAARGPGERAALAALERVLMRQRLYPEVATVLRRAADAAEDDTAAAELLYRQGDLFEVAMSDPSKAVRSYRDVLALRPDHVSARTALVRLLRTAVEDRGDIVATLEPLFEDEGDWGRLFEVLDVKHALAGDRHARVSISQQMTELALNEMSDPQRAFGAALRWLDEDPTSPLALQHVDQLAIATGRWSEVVDVVQRVAYSEEAGSGEERVALLSYLGDCRMSQLGDVDGAIAAYRSALEVDRGALPVLNEVIEIYRNRGELAGLTELLAHRADVLDDVPAKRADLVEVAALKERGGELAGAIAAWRRVLELDELDREAAAALIRLVRRKGDPAEIIAALSQAARSAASATEEHALRTQIAELETDPARVVLAWQAVLDLEPSDPRALSSLEAAYRRNKDWISVSDLQTRRLGEARSSEDKLAILAEMAELAEVHRDAPDDAVGHWYTALELAPAAPRALEELERLLGKLGRWHDVVELLERRAEQEGDSGNVGAELRLLARSADLWESKLDDPERAGELVERILQRNPASVPALTRLSRLHERAGDWAQSKAALERALALGPEGQDAADLFFRLAEVARNGDRDLDTAAQHLQQALRHDPGHREALATLETLARERRDTTTLILLLRRRAAAESDSGHRVEIALEIAELERKAGRPGEALAALQVAADLAPADARVLTPLADLLFLAGRLDEAAPIYERLADEAKAARRMRDVARFRQRQGAIAEARGDSAGALRAYEEAFRVNPTDVATMAGLGRLYFVAKEWEKARRLYQSLVLQTLDADSGIAKADVYWSLGVIHLELGQEPKAKGMFQRGLELDPRHEQLRTSLAQLGG
ncbi:MAG: tetratricopeptide repeat protein [Kofleriaceae bacterium]